MDEREDMTKEQVAELLAAEASLRNAYRSIAADPRKLPGSRHHRLGQIAEALAAVRTVISEAEESHVAACMDAIAGLAADTSADGVNWERGGRVYQLDRRDQPHWPHELLGEDLKAYRRARDDYERRHGDAQR